MATDEDLLAAEWESVSDTSTDDINQPVNAASSGNNEPVLNQDEIDSLLGLEENDDEDLVTGIQAIVSRQWCPTRDYQCSKLSSIGCYG